MFSFLVCFNNCFFRLPDAVAQLLSDKLKEVANHTRQFTKKKRLQSNNVSENSCSSLSQETLELSKDTYTEENLSLQKQLTNDAAVIDEAGSKSDTRLMQFNQDKNLSTMSEIFSQVVPRQSTSETKEESSANVSKHHNEEQVTSLNQDSALSSEPKLYQSNHTEQNNEHTERNRTDKSDPAESSELKSSTTDSLNQECNEQNNIQKRTLPQSPLPSPSPSSSPSLLPTPTTTTTTTTIETTNTTTMTTTKTITPYVSILMHLKKPR